MKKIHPTMIISEKRKNRRTDIRIDLSCLYFVVDFMLRIKFKNKCSNVSQLMNEKDLSSIEKKSKKYCHKMTFEY